MAQIIQPHSLEHVQEEDISFSCYQAVKEAKINARGTLQILASLYDSTNSLCSSLDKLDSFMESIIFCETKEKSSPQAEPFD